MSSKVKKICHSINRKQHQSICDFTSGHLNENHLYNPRPMVNGVRKPSWGSSQKPYLTLRPPNHLKTYSNNVEKMKESLVDFTYVTLPEIPEKKQQKQVKFDDQQSSTTSTSDQLPPIKPERIRVPYFSIDLSEEQRMVKMKKFDDAVLQSSDCSLHGLGYSEDFVAYIEQNLLLKLAATENQNKRQTISLNRLQAYGEAMDQLIEGSIAFGPILERIKDEYELYLDHLLANQPQHGSHIAEQLKRLRQAQSNFSTADSELFDIEKIEEQTRQAIQRNRELNEELKRVKDEQIQMKAEASNKLFEIQVESTEMKIKSQAELIDEARQNIFDMLDEMTRKKQELNEKFVPISVCTQYQQAIRDSDMDIIKTSKQNEMLLNEIDIVKQRIKTEITSHDQSEFVEENLNRILDLLNKVDILHMKRSSFNTENADDKQFFLHTYDDYFS